MTCYTCHPQAAVPYRRPVPVKRLGGLGISAAGGQAANIAAQAGAKAGSAAIASSAGLAAGGLAAGALTAGVGLVVAFALGKLLNKNYLNVPAMNAGEDQDVAAYNQYLTIMGQAPGRAFGLPVMLAVWRGANHSGLFPRNNGVQCFHEGCSKYPGRADWVNGFVNDYGVHGNLNFPDALYRFKQDRNAADFGALAYSPHPTPGAVAASTPQAYVPPAAPAGALVSTPVQSTFSATPVVAAIRQPVSMMTGTPRVAAMPRVAPIARGGLLRGLGQAAPGIPDAVNFVDNFLLPYNSAHSTWVVPQTSTEHQILYDVADAYLADRGISSTPYIASPTVAAPPTAPVAPVPVPGNIAQTMMPNYSATPLPPGFNLPSPAQPMNILNIPAVPAAPPPQSSIPNYGTVLPNVDTSGALSNPTLPAATTAGLSGISPTVLAIAAGLALVSFALARPVGKTPKAHRT